MSVQDCFPKCHLVPSTCTFVIKHLRAIFKNILKTPPDYPSCISHIWTHRQEENIFLSITKNNTIFSEYVHLFRPPLKRTYHFQRHRKDSLGKDRLEEGAGRMQLSLSAERKKKTERVMRVKGCLLTTAFNSFVSKPLGEDWWSDFQTLRGNQQDYLLSRNIMLFLLIYLFFALYFCENHFLPTVIFNVKVLEISVTTLLLI